MLRYHRNHTLPHIKKNSPKMDIFRNMLYMARRFKSATALNFIGLVVAFAACYLFLTQVTYNHSYNKGLTDHERLYRVEVPSFFDKQGKWQSHINRLMAEVLATMPQIERMGLIEAWTGDWKVKNGDSELNFSWCKASDDAVATLAPKLIDGKLAWNEGEKGVIMPASMAKTYFGDVQMAGRYIWGGGDSVLVRGVFEDFPTNSSARNCVYSNMGDDNKGNFSNWNYICYVRLKENTDTTGLSNTFNKAYQMRLQSFLEEHGMLEKFEEVKDDVHFGFRLRPVSETWFSGVDSEDDKGNRMVDLILQLSCMLVIIIVAINFLNFTLAESPMRIRSINTRRVLGGSTAALRIGMVGETVVTALVAYAVALLVAYLLSQWPFIAEMTVSSIALADHLPMLLALAGVAVAVGVTAGLYPAFYATSFQPALVLKGSFGLTPKGRQLRTILLCLQFIITSVMAVYIGILNLQSHYIFHSDYGFAKDEVLAASLYGMFDKRDAFRSELLQMSGVKDVSFSQFILGSGDQYMTWGREDKGHQVMFTCLPVDWRYLRTMGIKVIEGRDFNEHDGDCYIINEAARRQWDWVEMDKSLLDEEGTVVGVCQNVRFFSTRMDNHSSPMAFLIMGASYQGWDNLGWANVRLAAGTDKVQMRQKIREVLMKLGANGEPEVRFIDQQLEDTYQEEFRFMRQVMVFSIICLVITLIGVFCMTMFEAEYRRKEIGIRKVMGSSTGEILAMLCRRYVWLLLISFVFAAPLAWHFGSQWLQGFAERTPIYWWLFPLALIAVATVTLLTVIVQSWRTANENPVNSIKTE